MGTARVDRERVGASNLAESPYVRDTKVESAVALLLAESSGKANATTISFFSEVAHHPTSIWVSLSKHTLGHELSIASERFSLVVLHSGQAEIARRCGTVSGRDHDKIATLRTYRNDEGFLFLNDAIASVACRVRDLHELGDHTILIGDVLSGDIETRRTGSRHLLMADL